MTTQRRAKWVPGMRVSGVIIGTQSTIVGTLWSLAPGGWWVIPDGNPTRRPVRVRALTHPEPSAR